MSHILMQRERARAHGVYLCGGDHAHPPPVRPQSSVSRDRALNSAVFSSRIHISPHLPAHPVTYPIKLRLERGAYAIHVSVHVQSLAPDLSGRILAGMRMSSARLPALHVDPHATDGGGV